MPDRLLEAIAPRVDAADVIRQTDQTATVAIDGMGVRGIEERSGERTQLRVINQGRMGIAGSEQPAGDRLIDEALSRARSGPASDLILPLPAPTPPVTTHSRRVMQTGIHDLVALGRLLLNRLNGNGGKPLVWVERSVGQVRIVNTRGVVAQYPASLIGLGAEVWTVGTSVPCRVGTVGCSFPGASEIENLVDEVGRRTEGSIRKGTELPPALPVVFAPRAVARLLAPIRALAIPRDRRSPTAQLTHEVDSTINIWDDPWAPGRPGSRPIDDDGVVTRPVSLIEEGRLVGYIADLELGAQCNLPSTGHGARGGMDPSRPRFSNLRMLPGSSTYQGLLVDAGTALLVHEIVPMQGEVRDGRFHAWAPWCHVIHRGEVRERVEGVSVLGNLFDLFRRVIGISREAQWVGPFEMPYLALDGVGIRAWKA